ncbi:MAG TPA: hypothetical protein VFH43_12720 [Candidatus Kapabacteria bacterium]|nr:hypothetical protein [Candidatus Kapabacteria bacterium]
MRSLLLTAFLLLTSSTTFAQPVFTRIGEGSQTMGMTSVNGVLFNASHSGLMTSSDRGLTWTQQSNQVLRYLHVHQNESGVHLFASPVDSMIWRATGGSFNFEGVAGTSEIEPYDFSSNAKAVVALTGPSRAYMSAPGGYGVRVSTDGGATWVLRTEEPMMSTGATNEAIFASVVEDEFLWRSTDNGMSWTTYHDTVRAQKFFTINDGNSMIIRDHMRVLRTDDHGSTWRRLPDSLKSFFYSDSRGKHVLAASTRKLWYSSDNGETWANISESVFGTDQSGVNALHIDDEGYMYVMTIYGLYRTSVTNMNVHSAERSGMNVRYDAATRMISIDGANSIELLDVLGAPVMAGLGFSLDVRSVPNGIYFLRSGTLTAKVLVY